MDDQREAARLFGSRRVEDRQVEDERDAAVSRSRGAPTGDADPGKAKPAKVDGRKDDLPDDAEGGKGDDGKEKKNSRLPLIILAIVVVLGAIAGGIYWYLHRNQIETDDAYTEGNAVLIAPQVNGYVTVLAITDNQFVHKGDLLVQIDTRPYAAARDQAQSQVLAAQAQLDNAKANLDLAKATFPARLHQAEAQREQARAEQAKAQEDLKRQRSVDPRATTQQAIDAAVAAARSADATAGSQQANVEINRPVPLNIAVVATQVQQAQAQVAQAQAQLEQADLNVAYTHVVAPQDGWVTRRNVEMGNYLQPGTQIMALVTPEVWVTANFKETELNRMRPGQRVTFSVDAYPGLKLRGHVNSIQHGSGSRFSAFPAENATGNYVKIVQRVPVKLVIDEGLDPSQSLPLGLSVEPTVYFE